jgi:hypothetical protein
LIRTSQAVTTVAKRRSILPSFSVLDNHPRISIPGPGPMPEIGLFGLIPGPSMGCTDKTKEVAVLNTLLLIALFSCL